MVIFTCGIVSLALVLSLDLTSIQNSHLEKGIRKLLLICARSAFYAPHNSYKLQALCQFVIISIDAILINHFLPREGASKFQSISTSS